MEIANASILEEVTTETRQAMGKQEIRPPYMRFTNRQARIIANCLYPVKALISATIATLLLVYNDTSWFFWWLCLGIFTPSIVINTYAFIRWIIGHLQVRAYDRSIVAGSFVEEYDGGLGAGKTSQMLENCKLRADARAYENARELKLLEPYMEDIKNFPELEREDAEEIIEAENYYAETGSYPYLWTSIPCKINGVWTNMLTAAHLLQEERLPYGTVAGADEVDLIIPPEIFRDKPYEFVEMCKFPRHIGNYIIAATNQTEEGTVIYLRRVSSKTRHIIEQTSVLEPRFRLWLEDFLERHTRHMTKFKANVFRIWRKILKNMGFRKYWYWDEIKGLGADGGKKSCLRNPSLSITYDSRSFKHISRCEDKPLKKSVWSNMRLDKPQIDAIFPKDLRERGKSQAQKKADAIRRKTNGKKENAKASQTI